jgi:hypothetical protein
MAVKHLIVAALLYPPAAYAGSCTDPGNFAPKQRIETAWADFLPNQRAVYSDGEEQATVTVLPAYVRTRGIWWRAINDTSISLESGLLGEVTVDLYAENRQGDVCYGGEATYAFEYDPFDLVTDGTFIHGLDGETAGTYMVANPTVGQRWTIESIEGGTLREEAEVIARTGNRITIRITHFEDGELVETETKVFDARGELSASVPGEPTSTRRSITS